VKADLYKKVRPEEKGKGTFEDVWKINELKDSSDKELQKLGTDIEQMLRNRNIKEAKITALPLGTYSSKERYSEETLQNGKTRRFVLVGDASSGVPFFRSLNKGTKEAQALAETVSKVKQISSEKVNESKSWWEKLFQFGFSSVKASGEEEFSENEKITQLFQDFAKSSDKITKWEIFKARVKSSGVSLANQYFRCTKNLFGFISPYKSVSNPIYQE
tara:strand:- start:174 stop:824 length:651 start_codon:yes stop_codon:yes gene_type:complete